jgi:PhzF family phenazine biosynthesis protein
MNAPVRLPLLQVDAFSRDPFGGNPAAIVFLDSPRDTAWLQAVAGEMNLSETAFLLRRDDGHFDLRWFTPAVEVTLCGHATLASAYALWSTGRAATDAPIVFETLSGALTARPEANGTITIDLPARAVTPATLADGVAAALGVEPRAVHAARKGPGGTDYIVEAADEASVVAARPDFGPLKAVDGGIILTARASTAGWDFVSRYFVPAFGIDEDPVTGSAHCALATYWAERLGKTSLTARQVSKRGGTLQVRLAGDRVHLSGHAVTVLSGELLA